MKFSLEADSASDEAEPRVCSANLILSNVGSVSFWIPPPPQKKPPKTHQDVFKKHEHVSEKDEHVFSETSTWFFDGSANGMNTHGLLYPASSGSR
ncbi:MAG: hypothetical protein K2F69_04585 [Bacteroidaceae bacterium]|nr:hypothetical protein [Bacteroidaceae bacterium]